MGFAWVAPQEDGTSYYMRLRERVMSGDWPVAGTAQLKKYFEMAEASDDNARDAIDAYIEREEVKRELSKERGI